MAGWTSPLTRRACLTDSPKDRLDRLTEQDGLDRFTEETGWTLYRFTDEMSWTGSRAGHFKLTR
jgi:hypothetical protein